MRTALYSGLDRIGPRRRFALTKFLKRLGVHIADSAAIERCSHLNSTSIARESPDPALPVPALRGEMECGRPAGRPRVDMGPGGAAHCRHCPDNVRRAATSTSAFAEPGLRS
jgi:hypothetical protein